MDFVARRSRDWSVSAAALALVALIGAFVLSRGAASRSATVAPAACVSVSCETFVVFDSQNGGLQMPPPCVNHGCPAGCSGGNSAEGGGWQTCKCGGQVEPRCCHLLYRDNGEGGYEQSFAGSVSRKPIRRAPRVTPAGLTSRDNPSPTTSSSMRCAASRPHLHPRPNYDRALSVDVARLERSLPLAT
jgi:hypothetical protein